MHISEGVLSAPVLLSGALASGIFVVAGFKKLKIEDIPATAVMSSLMFVASFIHIPIGPTSTHLVLNGFTGAVLGTLSFPAVFIALILQALLFQFGGFTTLGITTFNVAFPAVLAGLFFRKVQHLAGFKAAVSYFMIGFMPVALSTALVALTLSFTDESFVVAAKLLFAANIPVMIIEGVVTMFMLRFICKMKVGVIWRADP